MNTPEELKAAVERYGVHPVFGAPGELDAWIEQNPRELAVFLAHMQALRVQTMLEVGTGWKGGLSRFLAAELGWDVTSVDIKDYGHQFQGVHYIISEEKPTFDPAQFDLVLIDAQPTYESTRANWEHYAPYAAKAVAVHDIAGLRDCEGVTRFWREMVYDDGGLRSGAYEVIDDSPRRGGIGYVMPAEVAPVSKPTKKPTTKAVKAKKRDASR